MLLPINFSNVSEAECNLEEVLEDQPGAGAMGRAKLSMAFQPQIRMDAGQHCRR